MKIECNKYYLIISMMTSLSTCTTDKHASIQINAKTCRKSMQVESESGLLEPHDIDTITTHLKAMNAIVIAINKYTENSFVFTFIEKDVIDAAIKAFSNKFNCELNTIQLVNDKMEPANITPLGFLVQSKFNVTWSDGSYRVEYPACIIP